MQPLIKLKDKYANKLEHGSELLLRLPSLVFFCFFGVFLFYLSDNASPTDLYDGQVLTQHVHPGGNVVFQFKADRRRVCEVDYVHLMYDSTGTRFPIIDLPALRKRKVVNGDIVKIGLEIPRGMQPGPAVYESERHYICNFTQRFISPLIVSNPDISFNVEASP